MDPDQMIKCLTLLRTADAMLMEGGELIIAAHLSMAMETLCARARAAGHRLELCGDC